MTRSHPIPMQDEFALGILGRFARMNAIPSLDLAAKTIKRQTNERDSQLLWLIAELCGKSKCDFSSKHSVLPVLNPISKSTGNSLESWSDLFLKKNRAMNCLQGHIRWCQECCENDINKHHFSYWRRSHQIVGIDWCPHHRTPLAKTNQKFAINNPGHPSTIDTVPTRLATIKQEIENATLMRLQEIMFGWLQRSYPIGLQAWANVIRVKCSAAGLRIGEIGKRPVVSDLIREHFPSSWLSRHMPEVANKSPNTFVRKIDGACIDKHVAYPALAYASILSVLFDSSEQALHALDAANLQLDIQPSNENVNEALSAFLEGASLHDACRKSGVNVSSVENAVRHHLQQFLVRP
ncbi:TniQ family protein [Undibacterium sp. KW1]|uniref:TniQ family protein n=1 Tax=Undibacterium sp. KW1 TaxID=2058624 RepID=UPI00138969E8|nr:TniQ family protein [Undibacterium sp. KW1]